MGKLLPCYKAFLSLCSAVPEFAGSAIDRAKARKGVVLHGQKRGKRRLIRLQLGFAYPHYVIPIV